ncbi:hypothetical protein LN040_07995 [Desulfovibrio subterraneus]|jgi:hypothetical protein|uniref:Uncharacterized protein n=1 Tax=Desulfovibrio subterraneus TaxID=2718620 RepID=A0A7J0BEX0_9BACT|nr:hypothetical protein [Desulfovibrio subterraneus]WBF69025.1 hypothetical protein LN040_07995 [Desulfovibrio subterraneus]GFM32237.1 hypothetical protein DSM101010T_06020 [Desulfovibrio subterraneus]
MREYSVKRNGKEELVFTGDLLVTLDDREWMGVTPNWWELTLYKTSVGKYILASTFHINYPGRRKMHGAISFSSAEAVRDYLVHDCNGPSMIAEALLARAARRDEAFRFKPVPVSNIRAFTLIPRPEVGMAGSA